MLWYSIGSAIALIGSDLLCMIEMNTIEPRVYGFVVLTALGIGFCC